VKINKWETNALKNALDDACRKVSSIGETERFSND
jgi:hypothetical protein